MSLINVAMNSSHVMPIHYRVAAVWGNHEGSILLLAMYFSIASVVFYKLSYSWSSVNYCLLVQLSFNIILLLFIINTSNPFIRVFPVPHIGLGLNPVLQDSGLVLHPPILYLGHAGCFIIYSIGLAFCRARHIEVIYIRPWVLFSLSCLTLGIGMGSWWAYKEIGWGGYWFWDPVENISLLPWLALVSLLHSIGRGKNLYNVSFFLSIISFLTVLFGIFIVRAGLLKSVHSFAQDTERGFLLLSVFLTYTSYSCWELSNGIVSTKSCKNSINRLIFLGSCTFIGCILIILIGILYPLMYELFNGISVTIGANFFNITFNSLIIFSLILCIVATTILGSKFKSYFPLVITSIITLFFSVFFFNKIHFTYLDLLAICGFFTGLHIIIQSFFSYLKFNKFNIFMVVSHSAFGLGVLAISVSSLLSIDHQQLMGVGDTIKFSGFEIELSDVQHNLKSNYIAKTAIIKVKSNNSQLNLYPELRIFPVEKQMTSEPAILRQVLYDLHINISQVTNDGYLFTFYYRPLINWLWLAIFVMSNAIMISALKAFIKLHKQSKFLKKDHCKIAESSL
jgi:cytochrome c-type biogenesis protein CcmF